MIDTYFPVFVLMLIAAGFVTSMLVLSIVLGPRKYSQMKDDPFECGTIGTGDATQRLGVRFYLVAMVFILFDIEVVFLYPWAVEVTSLGWPAFFAMLSFLFVFVVGLVYIWKQGVLDWK